VKGGHYAAFVAAQGQPADLVAKAARFFHQIRDDLGRARIKNKTFSPLRDRAAQFAPVPRCWRKSGKAATASARQGSSRHQALPGPALDRRSTERQPFALWQCDGKVLIVGRRRRTRRRDCVINDSFICRSSWAPGPMRNLSQYMALLDTAEICANGSWRECSSRSAAGR